MSSESIPPAPSEGLPQGSATDMQNILLGPMSGTRPATQPGQPWVPPTPEELQRMLPQYEIHAMLGRGGMGAVYQARQVSLDRMAAIKILSNDLENMDASFSERFKNEARAMARLSHPGIITVYDFGQTETGLLYIVMEFVEGTDVHKMISASGRLHTEHAMAITAHICDALHYAHERGIIHRDIKPANIMVGYDGSVKVADFGLAKVNVGGETLGLTQSGMAMGTPHYIAPEALILGSQTDRRADIYAVGVMLYHMLTGKLPQGLFELPSIQVPGLDPRYDGIIARAMREDREQRYATAADMRADLDSILTQPVPKAEPEASSSEAPAATLPHAVRPQRPGAGQPRRPSPRPQPQVIIRTERKSSPLPWLAMLATGGVAAWLFLLPGKPAETTPPPAATQSPALTSTSGNDSPASALAPQVRPSAPAKDAHAPASMPPVVDTVKPFTPEPGWTSLFNGTDMSGWTGDTSSYRARDGVLSAANGKGTISTEKEFGDFALRFELRLLPGAHAEISLREQNPPQPSRGAPNASFGIVLHDDADPASASWEPWRKHGAVYGYQEPLQTAAVAAGTWTEYEIRVEKQHLTLKMGGTTVQNTPLANLSRKAPGGRSLDLSRSTGRIGILSFKGGAEFRHLRIMELDAVSDLLVGRWKRTNMDRAGDAYLMDIFSDGTAAWIGDNTVVKGTWLRNGDQLVVEWKSRFKFEMSPPADAAPNIMSGKAVWPDGKSTAVIYEKLADSATPNPNLSVSASEDASWQPLFPSDSLEGWKDVGEGHSLTNGVLTCSASGRDLISPGQYGNFHLKFDVKLSPGANNGIGIWRELLPGGTDLDQDSGFEVQLLDDTAPEFARVSTWQKHGGIYHFKEPASSPMNAPGTWNAHEIRVEGTKVTVIINNVTVLDADLTTLRPLVARRSPLRLDKKRGHLVFMGNKGPVEFRSVMIKDLDASVVSNPSTTPAATPTLWTDTQGRTLTAKFLRIEGANAVLEINGKPTPVSLALLSPESRQIALQLQGGAQSPPETGHKWLVGRWHQTNDANTAEVFTVLCLPDNKAIFEAAGRQLEGTWEIRDGQIFFQWSNGYSYEMRMPSSVDPKVILGQGFATDRPGSRRFEIRMEKVGEIATAAAPPDLAKISKEQPFVNSLGMKFVPVPGTRVLMCIHETRRADFARYAKEAGNVNSMWQDSIPESAETQQEDHPVANVTWPMAASFCTWLSTQEGRTYRLPSDREWSHAVGIGEEEARLNFSSPSEYQDCIPGVYPWGKEFPPRSSRQAGNLADTSWQAAFRKKDVIPGYKDGFAITSPVMSFQPNKLGIYDLSGNVREWTRDLWANDGSQYVLRGGCWLDNFAGAHLSSRRWPHRGTNTNHGCGFRVVIEQTDH